MHWSIVIEVFAIIEIIELIDLFEHFLKIIDDRTFNNRNWIGNSSGALSKLLSYCYLMALEWGWVFIWADISFKYLRSEGCSVCNFRSQVELRLGGKDIDLKYFEHYIFRFERYLVGKWSIVSAVAQWTFLGCLKNHQNVK